MLASREMMGILRNELAKADQLQECITKLESGKSEMNRTTTLKENFFNAICSGVISVDPPKVAYISETFGMTEEVILSEPRMEPFGKYVPLYQACG